MVLKEARVNEYERLQQTVHTPDGDKLSSKSTASAIKKDGDSRMDAANLRRAAASASRMGLGAAVAATEAGGSGAAAPTKAAEAAAEAA